MNMTINELGTWMADFVQVGFMEAVRAYEPTSDELKLKEIKAWCKAALIDFDKLTKLIKAGMITAHRKGTAVNSPLYYSKAEIKKAVIQAKLSQYITDKMVRESRVI